MRSWAFLFILLSVPEAHAGWISSHYSDSFGSRAYTLYVPSPRNGPRPLVLFLHGCNESPEEFIGGSRIAEAAEARGLFVLVPKQDTQDNPEHCWNWFLPYNQMRDSGEEGLLAGMTARIQQTYGIDSKRVFVAGLSAGGAMANVLASCHSDLFSAVASHSGMPFRAASDPMSALWSVAHGSMVAPSWAGMLAYQCSGMQARRMPLLLIQGTEDQRVMPVNADQILQGFAAYNDWADDGYANQSVNLSHATEESDVVLGGYPFTTRSYSAGGKLLLQSVSVIGMAHAWSGGDARFPRTDAKGPDFTGMMLDFFEKVSR